MELKLFQPPNLVYPNGITKYSNVPYLVDPNLVELQVYVELGEVIRLPNPIRNTSEDFGRWYRLTG